jgi:tight adherence protein B
MISFLIIIFVITSIILFCFALIPPIQEFLQAWRVRKEKAVAAQLDKLFYDKSPKQLVQLYFILPPILAIIIFVFTQAPLFAFLAALLGLFIPNLILKIRDTKRRVKFNNQILDAIMIMSSSLKGGLSLLQALEVLTEEMPAPMSQEIGLVVRENKIGISLEESLSNLNKRMNMEELSLVINSIMVARETGGDLTKVFSRLATTIRDNRKLKESIRTLTLQGRMQGVIMSALPFIFIWWVLAFNREHFEIMFKSDTGRMIVFVGIVLQVVGMFLIRKFSTIKV